MIKAITNKMNAEAKKEDFLSIIEHNKKLIYKVCNSYCKDAENRQDLTQEIIIRLWQSYDTYDNRYKLSTWMYRIALNTAISYYRSGRRRSENTTPLQDNLLEISGDAYDAETDERIKNLYAIINSMDELNRALMILYLDNNSYRDIAEILGISESNVGVKIGRIKAQMKQQLEKITI